tara:strand:- start:232 stop:846 length:615 start_codon:yes stop_codon:yes gene_type:complete
MLKIHNLSYAFTDKYLFEDISLNILSGECLKVSGSNGSGKSTFLKNIAGILSNYEGDIHLNNENTQNIGLSEASKIYYLGHKQALKTNLTIMENIKYDLRSNFVNTKKILSEMSKFGFEESLETVVGTLSEGQKKKILLATFSVTKSDLYILDEPSTNLDKNGCDYLVEVIESKTKEGATIIYTAHEDKFSFSNEIDIDKYKNE